MADDWGTLDVALHQYGDPEALAALARLRVRERERNRMLKAQLDQFRARAKEVDDLLREAGVTGVSSEPRP